MKLWSGALVLTALASMPANARLEGVGASSQQVRHPSKRAFVEFLLAKNAVSSHHHHHEKEKHGGGGDRAERVVEISSPPPNEWLFAFELTLFATAAGLAFHQGLAALRRAAKQSATHNLVSPGGKARPQFLLTLAAALALRTVSLLLGIFPWKVKELHGGDHTSIGDFDGLRLWCHVVGRSGPSLVFLTAYTQITVFFAEIYYRTEFTEIPLLRPLTRAANILSVVLFLVIAIVTLVHHHHDFSLLFRECSMLFLGFCFVIIAFFWAWYGSKVARRLQERTQTATEMMATGRVQRSFLPGRMLVLSTVCPAFFVVQGIYQILVGLGLVAKYYPEPLAAWYWDALVYFFVELLPSIVTLFIFWARRSPTLSSGLSPSFSPLAQSLVPQSAVVSGRDLVAVHVASDNALAKLG